MTYSNSGKWRATTSKRDMTWVDFVYVYTSSGTMAGPAGAKQTT